MEDMATPPQQVDAMADMVTSPLDDALRQCMVIVAAASSAAKALDSAANDRAGACKCKYPQCKKYMRSEYSFEAYSNIFCREHLFLILPNHLHQTMKDFSKKKFARNRCCECTKYVQGKYKGKRYCWRCLKSKKEKEKITQKKKKKKKNQVITRQMSRRILRSSTTVQFEKKKDCKYIDLEERCGECDECDKILDANFLQKRLKSIESNIEGYGLAVTEPIKRGEAVIEYRGNHVEEDEEGEYIASLGGMRIKPSKNSLCALINSDFDKSNCKLIKLLVNGKEKLFVASKRDLDAGTEITFDYGKHFHIDSASCVCDGCKKRK